MIPSYDEKSGFSPVSADELALVNGGTGSMSDAINKASQTVTKVLNAVSNVSNTAKKAATTANQKWSSGKGKSSNTIGSQYNYGLGDIGNKSKSTNGFGVFLDGKSSIKLGIERLQNGRNFVGVTLSLPGLK